MSIWGSWVVIPMMTLGSPNYQVWRWLWLFRQSLPCVELGAHGWEETFQGLRSDWFFLTGRCPLPESPDELIRLEVWQANWSSLMLGIIDYDSSMETCVLFFLTQSFQPLTGLTSCLNRLKFVFQSKQQYLSFLVNQHPQADVICTTTIAGGAPALKGVRGQGGGRPPNAKL